MTNGRRPDVSTDGLSTDVYLTALDSRISHGLQNAVVKGEDASAILEGASRSCFAVFDGHGGRKAAAHGAERLAPRLLALGAGASDGSIADAFWEADAEIGREQTDGSTATVLLVDGTDGAAEFCATIAWVGDSRACIIDLSAASGASDGPAIVGETTCHTGASATERCRLEQTWRVCRQLREISAQNKFALLQPAAMTAMHYSLDAVRAAANDLQISLSDDDAALMARTVERGSNIDLTRFSEASASTTPTSALAPRHHGGKLLLHKASHGVRLRREISFSPITSSTSTAVTRAIGDWDASRAIVPQPEILRVRCGPERCMRVVLASDGLWDFVPTAEARDILCTYTSSQACADRLVAKAVDRSKRRLNQLKDDTTVIVVTLNPSGLPPPLSSSDEREGCYSLCGGCGVS